MPEIEVGGPGPCATGLGEVRPNTETSGRKEETSPTRQGEGAQRKTRTTTYLDLGSVDAPLSSIDHPTCRTRFRICVMCQAKEGFSSLKKRGRTGDSHHC